MIVYFKLVDAESQVILSESDQSLVSGMPLVDLSAMANSAMSPIHHPIDPVGWRGHKATLIGNLGFASLHVHTEESLEAGWTIKNVDIGNLLGDPQLDNHYDSVHILDRECSDIFDKLGATFVHMKVIKPNVIVMNCGSNEVLATECDPWKVANSVHSFAKILEALGGVEKVIIMGAPIWIDDLDRGKSHKHHAASFNACLSDLTKSDMRITLHEGKFIWGSKSGKSIEDLKHTLNDSQSPEFAQYKKDIVRCLLLAIEAEESHSSHLQIMTAK